MSALVLIQAAACATLGVVLIVFALRIARMGRIVPTGQGMAFRNGRIEPVRTLTDDDIRRAQEDGR